MEAIESSSNEAVIDALSFNIPNSGQYITNRSSVTYQTIGSNIYSPDQGTKIVRFKLSDEVWLDPSSFRIMMTLVNASTDAATGADEKALFPVGGPWGFFKRLIIRCRGQIIEDISDYNRVHEKMSLFQHPDIRAQELAESIGYIGNPIDNWTPESGGALSIKKNESMVLMFKPIAGILDQKKFIPLRYCPLEIDLELSDKIAPIVFAPNTPRPQIDGATAGSKIDDPNAAPYYNEATQDWRLENLQCKADVCTIDNELDNEFAALLLEGKSLTLSFNTIISQMQTILSASTQINVTRSLSKLDSVFVSLDTDIDTENGAGARDVWWRKSWNDFFSPMWSINNDNSVTTGVKNDPALEIKKFQLQIGSKLYPEYPIQSHSEAFYQLRKTLGMTPNCITGKSFRNNRCILGISTEKIPQLAFSGASTKNSFVTVHLETPAAETANRMHVCLSAQIVLQINDASVSVFD